MAKKFKIKISKQGSNLHYKDNWLATGVWLLKADMCDVDDTYINTMIADNKPITYNSADKTYNTVSPSLEQLIPKSTVAEVHLTNLFVERDKCSIRLFIAKDDDNKYIIGGLNKEYIDNILSIQDGLKLYLSCWSNLSALVIKSQDEVCGLIMPWGFERNDNDIAILQSVAEQLYRMVD